jgi:hypothetical protein
MLQLLQNPADLVLSRNPIVYKLRAYTTTQGDYSPTGVRASISFESAQFDVGNTIVVTYIEPNGLKTIESFVFATSVGNNPNFLPTTGVYPTFAAQCAAIAERIGKHPRISPFFTVTSGAASFRHFLQFTAKNTAPYWSLHLSDSVVNFSHQVSFTTTAAAASQRPANHKLLYDVFFESDYQSGLFDLISENETFVNESGFALFDIKDILDSAFTRALSERPIPNFSDTTPQLSDNLRRYFVRIGERYGTPATIHNATYIGTAEYPNLVRLGGIAENQWENNVGIMLDTAIKNRVLSWQPTLKTVGRYQPEWLGVTSWGDVSNFAVKVTALWEDGTTENYTALTNSISLKYGETLLLPVNIAALRASSADKVERYTVTVIDAATNAVVSEAFSYTIDSLHHQSERYLMYLNGFGVPQTMRMTGVFTPTYEIARMEFNRAYAPNGRLVQSGSASSRHVSSPNFVYRSGHLQREELFALLEFTFSEHVFEVFEEGFIPLQVLDKKMKMPETDGFTECTLQITAASRLSYRNYGNGVRFTRTVPQAGWKATDFDLYNRLAYALKW